MLSSKFFVFVVSTLFCLNQVSILFAQPIEDAIFVGNLDQGRKPGLPAGITDQSIPLPETFSDQLSNSEQFNFAEDIDDLKVAFQAFSELPKDAYVDLEESVKRIISKIPGDNVIKNHLKNGMFVMSLYEKVVKGEVNLDNEQQVVKMFTDGREAMDDLRVEVGGTGSIVQSTMQKAPHEEATKQSLTKVSQLTNTPTETLISEFSNQPAGLLQRKKAPVGDLKNNPSLTLNQEPAHQPGVVAEQSQFPFEYDILKDYDFGDFNFEDYASPKGQAGVGQPSGTPKQAGSPLHFTW